MNGPAALIVLVGAGEAAEPTTQAMDRATRAALDDATVEVREARTRVPSDDEALAVERTTHAVAVVELRWADATRRNATLRVHLAEESRWVERAIGFRATDAFAERGRTLGFAVASMLPEEEKKRPSGAVGAGAATATAPGPATVPATASAPATPTPTASAPATATAPTTATAPAATSTSSSTPTGTSTSTSTSPAAPTATSASTSAPSPTAPSTSAPSVPSRFSLDLLALATLGVESSPTTFGGAAALGWVPFAGLSSLGLRAGASLRAGGLSQGAGNTFTFAPSVGVTWRWLVPVEGRPWGVSTRLDYLAVDQTVTRGSTTLGRNPAWMSGLGGAVDAEVRVAAGTDLVLGIGLEEVFSPTYVYAGSARAELPSTRALAEAGVRLGF